MWPALIGAGASIVGGLIGSGGAARQNEAQREMMENQIVAQKEMAYAQQQFQERMSSTAYQRSMADMQAAGLNPILAYQQGGASSPGGAMGSAAMAQLENEMAALGEGVSSAAQSAKDSEAGALMREQSKNTISQTELNKANENLTKSLEDKAKVDTVTSAAQATKLGEEAALARQQTGNAMITAGILHHNTNSAASEARIKQAEADNANRYGPGPVGAVGATGERFVRRVIDSLKSTSKQPASVTSARQGARESSPIWGAFDRLFR